MRRIFPFLLLLGLLCVLPLGSACAANDPEEFAYLVCEDHVEIQAYIGTRPTVEIPEYIEGKPVTVVRLGKSYYGDQGDLFTYVRKVILPSTIETLSDFAFGMYNCLETVEGLEHVKRVEEQAFWGSSLKEAHFSDNLEFINMMAFNTSAIQTLTIPNDVSYEYGLCLYDIEQVNLIDGSSAPTIMLKDDLLLSADETMLLSVLPGMKDVHFVIPDNITVIGYSALSNLNFVDEIVIPATMEEWNGGVSVSSGTTLYVHAGSPAEAIIKRDQEIYVSNYTMVILDADAGETLDAAVDKIISQVIQPGMTDVQKARALHDWIIDNGSYDYSLTNFNASHILTGGSGVCDAYARAYSILLSAVGIENRREECAINGVSHAITAVLLNGKWYLVDCTNDDEGFGRPDSLFCFDQRVYDAFYTGILSVSASSIDLYAPYTSGSLDEFLTSLTSQIQTGLDSESTTFEVTLDESQTPDPIHAQALCSILESQEWTAGGSPITLTCHYLSDICYQIVLPETNSNEYAYYEVDGGVCLTDYLYEAESIVVPDQYQGMKVVALEGTFRNDTALRSVTLPEGLERIGAYTFCGCTQLSSVNIPSTVTAIETSAFHECISLEGAITLPQGLTTLGDYAFAHCILITEINLPVGVTEPGAAVFADCTNLSSVSLKNGLLTISDSMFHSCISLQYLTLPGTVTTIDHGAFAFSGLACLDLPSSVSSVAWDAFYNANDIRQLSVQSSSPYFAADGNMLFSRDMKTLLVSTPGIEADLRIPSFVEAIGPRAFAMNAKLNSVYIPSSVKTIGDYAFIKSNLRDVYIEDGLTSLGVHALSGSSFATQGVIYTTIAGDSGLSSLRLPNTLTHIGEGALYGLHYFNMLVLPASLTTIDVSFINFPAVVYIPSSITYIAPQEITPLSWREQIIHGAAGSYAETFAQEYGYTFVDTSSQLVLSEQTATLLPQESYTLSVTAATGIALPPDNSEVVWTSSDPCVRVENGVLTADSHGQATITASWNGMSGACEVKVVHMVPGSLRAEYQRTILRGGESTSINVYIDEYVDGNSFQAYDVFRHGVWTCSAENVLSVDSTHILKTIGAGKCTLTFTLPGGESLSIDYIVTGRPYDHLDALQLPETVHNVEAESFSGTSLAMVVLPEGCTSIDSRAFADSPSLQYVYIPDSVTAIADDAFEDCPNVVIATPSAQVLSYALRHSIDAFLVD